MEPKKVNSEIRKPCFKTSLHYVTTSAIFVLVTLTLWICKVGMMITSIL